MKRDFHPFYCEILGAQGTSQFSLYDFHREYCLYFFQILRLKKRPYSEEKTSLNQKTCDLSFLKVHMFL